MKGSHLNVTRSSFYLFLQLFILYLELWYFWFFIFFTYIFQQSLRLDPDDRPTCTQLLKHEFFQKDGFSTRIQHDLKQKVHRETHNNPRKKNEKPKIPQF
jgi:hypothetical protein